MRKLLFAVSLMLIVSLSLVNEAKAQATSIMVYSSARMDDFDPAALLKGDAKQIPGMALIQQRRTFELKEGDTTIQLVGIPPTADFSTLSLRPATADAFKVLSQSLIAPAVDPDSMLRRAIGHEIIINRKAPPIADHGRTPETINAKLLSFDQHQLVVETSNRQLPVQIIPRPGDIAEIKLMADSAPATRATVSAQLSSSKEGQQEGILSYQTPGMTWHADHELLLSEDETKAHLASTITLVNRTGTAFDDARVHLSWSRTTSKEIYPLPQPIALAADAAQRVALLDAAEVSCQTVLACTPSDYSRIPTLVCTYLAIENSSKNHLGRALPAGHVRLIKQSADAAPTLLAEEPLFNVAIDDLILVRLGQPSGVSVKREIIERLDTERAVTDQTIQMKLRNRTNQPQKILLAEPRPSDASQIIQKSDDYQSQSRSILFRIDLPANDEKTITYTVRRPAQ